MKLLIIGPFPLPVHGCSLANQVFVKNLELNGEISFLSINTNAENVSSKKVGTFSFAKVFSFLKSYSDIFKVAKSDLVYTTPGQTFFGILKYAPFFLFCKFFGVPYIIHVHGNHLGNEYKSLNGFKKTLFAFFVKGASGGIVLSESLRSIFAGLLSPDKVYVAENFALDELTEIQNLKKPGDFLKVVYLSNLMKEKGILDVLDGLLLLKKRNVKFEANIAGRAEDEGKEEFEHKLKQLEGYVRYHGTVYGGEKIRLLTDANVFLLPTYYRMEGQPISLIEGMATGNIIVTTDFSGIPDIIGEKNGFFVKSQDPENIADTLNDISNNLNDYIEKYSTYNVQFVKQKFTESKFADRLTEIINDVYVKKSLNVKS